MTVSMDMWRSGASIMPIMKNAIVQSLITGSPLPKVDGLCVELGDFEFGGINLDIYLVDDKGNRLLQLISHNALPGNSYTLSDLKRSFTINVG